MAFVLMKSLNGSYHKLREHENVGYRLRSVRNLAGKVGLVYSVCFYSVAASGAQMR